MIGTILHEDSLLANLLEDSSWVGLRADICNENFESNWPDFISTEEIRELADTYRANGEMSLFYREYRNKVIGSETQSFKPEFFRYYDFEGPDHVSEDEFRDNPDFESIILADPAKTHKEGSANTAVVGVTINLKTQKLYFRDIVEKQLYPDELYNEMFDMADRLHAHVLGPEVTSLNEYITWPLQNEMMKQRRFYEIVEVKPRDKKASRAAALIPLYRTGMVLHNSVACRRYEDYLMEYPRPRKWDIIDCASNLISVLEQGNRFFYAREETPEQIEKEYEELLNEPTLPDGWRRI